MPRRGDGLGGAGSTWHTVGVSANHAIVACRCYLAVAANDEHGLLLQCHGFKDFINIIALQFHLCREGTETP